MPSPCLLFAAGFATVYALATQLVLWNEQSGHTAVQSGSVLEQLFGDSRRLLANHCLVQADVYLHSGVYPSIFDRPRWTGKSHLASAPSSSVSGTKPEPVLADVHETEEAARAEEHDSAGVSPGGPRDWLERFGQNFYPVLHTHLAAGQKKELLPWLRLAAELNPNQIETYTLGAYWLRCHMGKVQEAEEFLREGWRANPDSFEILFELGRLYEESHHDLPRARNLLEGALRRWQACQASHAEPDSFMLMQISGHLAQIEESMGRLDKAVTYLAVLRTVSPHPELVQRRIDHLESIVQPSKTSERGALPTSRPEL